MNATIQHCKFHLAVLIILAFCLFFRISICFGQESPRYRKLVLIQKLTREDYVRQLENVILAKGDTLIKERFSLGYLKAIIERADLGWDKFNQNYQTQLPKMIANKTTIASLLTASQIDSVLKVSRMKIYLVRTDQVLKFFKHGGYSVKIVLRVFDSDNNLLFSEKANKFKRIQQLGL